MSSCKGYIGLYDSPEELLRAAEAVRDAGIKKWDCHTPYPVHGLDDAMGLKMSPVPLIVLFMGGVGAGVAFLMQWWMDVIDYPFVVGGKPLFSWPLFIPITFELFVLFAALAAMGSVIWFCKLGRWASPLHQGSVMKDITSNRYGIFLDSAEADFNEDKARSLLEATACQDIRRLGGEA
ncbi:MAG: DUF3341 domain-containing protein [Fibrobacteria bacterium]|nr:DUF3341 domain-containing protein [Fibrobacteria bacterium]